jgi:hypothetical protein
MGIKKKVTLVFTSTKHMWVDIFPKAQLKPEHYTCHISLTNFPLNLLQQGRDIWSYFLNWFQVFRHTDERGILSKQPPTVSIQTLPFKLMWVWQMSSKGTARLHCVNQFLLTGWILVYLMTFSLNWEHHCHLGKLPPTTHAMYYEMVKPFRSCWIRHQGKAVRAS